MRLLPLWACAACVHALPPTMVPAELVTYETSDGWTMPIRHYPGPGAPVVLVHGMSATHRNWDFRPEVSLAAYLQEEGWDVWVPELRGDPGAQHPSRRAYLAFDFDDHADYDVPAMVDRVLEVTGERQVYWVGHSMGGMLLYAALADRPERIAGGVAISAPASFSHPIPIHDVAKHFRFLLAGRGRLPSRAIADLGLALGLGKVGERRVSTPDSMRPEMLHGLARHVLWPLTRPMAHQALGWLQGQALTSAEGLPWVVPADVPLLVMAGPEDGIVSEPDVALACEVYARCEYVQLSEAGGFSHDYGHIDPVLGRMARVEVFPRVADFLGGLRAEQRSPWGAVVTGAVATEAATPTGWVVEAAPQ